jgi:sodium/potassium-transporting ATPase subunit alpha
MMTGLFNYMLIIGSALCFLIYGIQESKIDKSNLYLAVVLVGVVVITAIFNYAQSSKASSIMA